MKNKNDVVIWKRGYDKRLVKHPKYPLEVKIKQVIIPRVPKSPYRKNKYWANEEYFNFLNDIPPKEP